MAVSMQTRIVRIGNSQGVRIPKPLLEQAGLNDRVDLVVEEGQIVIRAARRARSGWEEQFQTMAENGDDRLLDADGPSLTRWDEEEWQW